jgi:hypothetical protein
MRGAPVKKSVVSSNMFDDASAAVQDVVAWTRSIAIVPG